MMLAAGDIDGFTLKSVNVVHWEKNARDMNPLRGTIDMEHFELWVEEKMCPFLGNWDNFEHMSIVVIDKATIHHSKRVCGLIMAIGATIIYTTSYLLDLNPIEYYLRVYKSYLKKSIFWTCWKSTLGLCGLCHRSKLLIFCSLWGPRRLQEQWSGWYWGKNKRGEDFGGTRYFLQDIIYLSKFSFNLTFKKQLALCF